jgi:hypothetical protein
MIKVKTGLNLTNMVAFYSSSHAQYQKFGVTNSYNKNNITIVSAANIAAMDESDEEEGDDDNLNERLRRIEDILESVADHDRSSAIGSARRQLKSLYGSFNARKGMKILLN